MEFLSNSLNMPNAVHISTLRKMLAAGDPVDLRLWTKKGEIQSYSNCISLSFDFYGGTRSIKLLNSGQIRSVRDVCIFEINGLPVML